MLLTDARLWYNLTHIKQNKNVLKYLKQKEVSFAELKREVYSLLSHLPEEVRALPRRTSIRTSTTSDEYSQEQNTHDGPLVNVDKDKGYDVIDQLGILLKNVNYLESEYIPKIESLKAKILSVDVAEYSNDMWRDIKLSLNESTECEGIYLSVY